MEVQTKDWFKCQKQAWCQVLTHQHQHQHHAFQHPHMAVKMRVPVSLVVLDILGILDIHSVWL
jgi:hypothetical protein